MNYMELTEETGWWIAGILGSASIASISFIMYELRNAMEMPNDEDTLAHLNLSEPPVWSAPTGSPQAGSNPVPSFQVRQ